MPAVVGNDGDVLSDRHRLHQAEILMDEGDAGNRPAGQGRTFRPRHGSGIGNIDAGKDLDERRLASTVLAKQRVDLAAEHSEVHRVKRLGSPEALAQSAARKQRQSH